MKNSTEIIRVEKTKNYSVVHNGFLRRNDLSWKAKGILTYILSLPDDWKININELMKHSTDGERSFRSGWKELSEAGYVSRRPIREGQRIKFWETIVRENVDNITDSELCSFVDVQNLQVHSVHVQNHKLLNTNNTNNLNIQSTNNTNTHYRASESELKRRFEDIWTIYPNKKGKPKAFTAYKKAIKDGVTDDEIIKGLNNYLKEIEIKGTAKQYIKHGSTWFNNKGWEDDYDFTKVSNGQQKSEIVPGWLLDIDSNNNSKPVEQSDLDEEEIRNRLNQMLGSG